MTLRQSENGRITDTDGEIGGPTARSDTLHPLLQRKSSALSGDTYVHSAFLVDAQDHAVFTVSNREHGRQYQVKRAASCLLLPEPGDKVLVSGDTVGGLYIIAVLEQQAGGHRTVQVDGTLTISAHALSLQGEQHIALETDTVSVKAETGAVDAGQLSINSHHYALTSVELEVAALRSTYTGGQRESYYQSVAETTRRSIRYVTGTDTVKAINLDYSADFIARLNGNTTLISGESVVKADGKQILVG